MNNTRIGITAAGLGFLAGWVASEITPRDLGQKLFAFNHTALTQIKQTLASANASPIVPYATSTIMPTMRIEDPVYEASRVSPELVLAVHNCSTFLPEGSTVTERNLPESEPSSTQALHYCVRGRLLTAVTLATASADPDRIAKAWQAQRDRRERALAASSAVPTHELHEFPAVSQPTSQESAMASDLCRKPANEMRSREMRDDLGHERCILGRLQVALNLALRVIDR